MRKDKLISKRKAFELFKDGKTGKEILEILNKNKKVVAKSSLYEWVIRFKAGDIPEPINPIKNDVLKNELENLTLKNKVKELSNEIRDLRKFEASELNMLSHLSSIIPKVPVPKNVFKFNTKTKPIDTEVGLLVSDTHTGEVVLPEEIEYYNEYNFDVFANRFHFLLEEASKIVKTMRTSVNINTMNIFLLGDMVSGNIHEELLKTNENPILLTCAMTAAVLAQGFASLAFEFDKIKFTCVVGNHGRLTKKKEHKRGVVNNYDWITYQLMVAYLKEYIDKGIMEFHIPYSYETVVNIMDKKFLASHGDNIRMFYRTPYYGMENDSSKQHKMRRKSGGFDYRVMAHFHEASNLKGETLVNGSLIGASDYGKNSLHEVADPIQKLFGINKKYGISWEYNLNLKEANNNPFSYGEFFN